MEQFLEQSVMRKNRTLPIVSYWFFMVSMCVSGLTAMVGVSQIFTDGFTTETLLFTALFAVLTFYFFKMKDMMRIEFEYIFTEGEIDFDKVIAGKKRAHIITLRIPEIHEIGIKDSPGYQAIKAKREVSMLKLSLNKDMPQYYMHFTKKTRQGLMIFEPNDQMIGLLKGYAPHLFKDQA